MAVNAQTVHILKRNKSKKLKKSGIYDPFPNGAFDFKQCMISGAPLDPKDPVVRLFPDWLIQKYHLAGKRLALQTGEEIRYEDIKVPVARAVRKEGLDYLYRSVKDQLTKGHEGIKWIKPDHLYQWLSFVFYAVLYYEYYSALKNRKVNGFLFESAYINRFRILLVGLSAIYRPLTYKGFDPCTIVAFKVHPQNESENFDLKVGLNTMSISLRMGELGLLAALLDNATQKQFYGSYFDRFAFQQMHPIQFDELYSKVSYKLYLLNLVHEYGIALPEEEGMPIEIGMRIPEEQQETPVFMEWKEEIYLSILSTYLKKYGFTQAELQNDNGEAITFLEGKDGLPLRMNAEGKTIR